MRKTRGIIYYTVLEIFRNRVYYVLLLFAAVLVGSTLLLGSLGGEQRTRMIIDFGLFATETFALIIAIFASVTLIQTEMESRTLYLVLTRPVARYQFILGRFLGLTLVLALAYAIMAALHLALCRLVHVPVDSYYFLSLLFSWEKIVLITSVAIFFSLFATSTISAITFTSFFWVMGHFSREIKFLATRTTNSVLVLLSKAFYVIAPNFDLLNARDWASSSTHASWLWPFSLYGIVYTLAALSASVALFRRKEF